MLFIKPLIKTFLIACVMFFIVVFLGMKFHWVNVFKANKHAIKLKIPSQTLSTSAEKVIDNEITDFEPQIININEVDISLKGMTKQQIENHCKTLLRKSVIDTVLLELSVGNCVLSNYRGEIKNNNLNIGSSNSTNNRQIQTQKNNASLSCKRRVKQQGFSNEIEELLLQGMCVSNALNR